MKRHFGYIKESVICFITIVTAGVILFCYIPFCKLSQIGKPEENETFSMLGNYKQTWNRCKDYWNAVSFTKGTAFDNISCRGKDNTIINTDITFNWDNTISIRMGYKNYKLVVDHIAIDSVYTTEKMQPIGRYQSGATMESATIRIFSYIRFGFCDKKDNVIWIFKQPISPFNERNKLGFEIKINNIMIRTGKQSYFDY